MNARFWVYIHCPVKLTLRPGQKLGHSYGGPCEEGWFRVAETWEHTGDGVFKESTSDGRDCDGRLTQYFDSFAPLDQLRVREPYRMEGEPPSEGVLWPNWERVSASQRDEYAEMAGY